MLSFTDCLKKLGFPLMGLFALGAFPLNGIQSAPTHQIPADWMPLVRVLREVGYDFRFEKPPIDGAYGATNARKKILWVAPISVDMGIGRQTLIHEAVHAAQGCPKGKYVPIGWQLKLPVAVERAIEAILYREYPHSKFPIEREAFTMQSHPRAFAEIIQSLRKRCK